MNKTIIVVAALVLSVVFLVFRMKSSTSYDTRSLDHIVYPMHCTSCGASSSYTTAELKEFVRAGKIQEVPMQVRRFPCPQCGKIAAVSYPGVSDETSNRPK